MDARFKVVFNVKDSAGFLTERTAVFVTLREAMAFVRRTRGAKYGNDTVVGMPAIERA